MKGVDCYILRFFHWTDAFSVFIGLDRIQGTDLKRAFSRIGPPQADRFSRIGFGLYQDLDQCVNNTKIGREAGLYNCNFTLFFVYGNYLALRIVTINGLVLIPGSA